LDNVSELEKNHEIGHTDADGNMAGKNEMPVDTESAKCAPKF
jgi:hypothetical protein